MHTCVCVCVHDVCVGGHTCTRELMQRIEEDTECPALTLCHVPHPTPLKGLSLNLELAGGQQAPVTLSPPFTVPQFTRMPITSPGFLCGCWRFAPMSSHFLSNCLYLLTHSQSSKTSLWKAATDPQLTCSFGGHSGK